MLLRPSIQVTACGNVWLVNDGVIICWARSDDIHGNASGAIFAHTFVYASNRFGTGSTPRPPFLTSGEELSHSPKSS